MNSIHKAPVREFWPGSKSQQRHRTNAPTCGLRGTDTNCQLLLNTDTETRLRSPKVHSHDTLCELLAMRNLFKPLLYFTRVNITEPVVMDLPRIQRFLTIFEVDRRRISSSEKPKLAVTCTTV